MAEFKRIMTGFSVPSADRNSLDKLIELIRSHAIRENDEASQLITVLKDIRIINTGPCELEVLPPARNSTRSTYHSLTIRELYP
jgi:hypothetical protein